MIENMGSWQLYIRHAHRDTSVQDSDNGLSDKGRLQGRALVDWIKKRHPDRMPVRVVSSPKLRCLETAEFVAKWAGLQVEVDARLDEQNRGEKDRAFVSRIEDLYKAALLGAGTCWVSHGDVLPMILQLAGYSSAEVRKGDLFYLVDGRVEDLNAIREGSKPT